MHCYILYAHPGAHSFCRDVLNSFICGLKESGHTFEIGDLYQMGFKSDMDSEQYSREVGMNPDAPLPEDVKIEHNKISKSDILVFIYPVWWSDCPAILKGWFDRVWAYGYAYFYNNDGDRGSKISPDKALIICSAGHTKEHLDETGIAESMRMIMAEDRLKNVGFKDVKMEILGGMMPNDNSSRCKNLEKSFHLGKDFNQLFKRNSLK